MGIKMKITLVIGENKRIEEIKEGTTIKDVLEGENISIETVVVKKNNKIVMEEEFLEDDDTVEVIKVIYGG